MGIDKKKLNILKQDADNAFKAKQQAYEIRKTAFDKLSTLVQEYNDDLWRNYKRYSQKNSDAIELRKEMADEEHKEMVRSFEEAHQAYEEGDGELAKELSIDGYDHQARRDRLNQLVKELCQENSARKKYVEKHVLPRKISELLVMDLKSLQVLLSRADVLSIFIEALKDARFKDEEFQRLKAEHEEKQTAYKIYKQFGDDLALNDVTESSGNWDPLIRGWIDEHPVTLRIGKAGTKNEGDTLISDEHISRVQFDKRHNHYGNNRFPNIKEKRIEDAGGDRGAYTGPGH